MHRSILYFIIVLFYSCQSGRDKIPDISKINLSNQVIRFDQRLFQLDSSTSTLKYEEFWNQFQAFNEIYFKNILGFNTNDPNQLKQLTNNLINHPTYQLLQKKVDSIYNDNEFMDQIQNSIKILKYHIPNYEEPNIYTFISEFGVAHFVFQDEDRNGLGIGLDFFLGTSVPYHLIDPSNPSFSQYLTRTFNKDHLTTKTINALLQDLYPPGNYSTVLDYMIYNGKILYAMSSLVPTKPDSVIHEYTTDQMKWCHNNEYEIWAFLIDENILYSTDLRKYNKLINPSPSSPGMPADAPGRTANFSGYNIVKAFMDNSDSSMDELFKTDSKTILGKSKYKPKRSG